MYEKHSQIIREKINLKSSPVMIKFYENVNDVQNDFLQIQKQIIHCQAVLNASKGKSFYATADNLGCKNGVVALGLTEPYPELMDGSFFNQANVTCNKNCGKKLISKVPLMNRKIKAISYSPLENSTEGDVVIIIAKPRQTFDLIRAKVYLDGERVDCSVSGTQSLCGDIAVNTRLTDKMTISFGCMGSHYATDLEDDKVIIGIPTNLLDDFVGALETVTSQVGRK